MYRVKVFGCTNGTKSFYRVLNLPYPVTVKWVQDYFDKWNPFSGHIVNRVENGSHEESARR